MNRSGSRTWTFLLLTLLAVLSLALHEAGQLQPLENLALLVVSPLQRTLADAVGGLSGFFETSRDIQALQEEIARLRAENNDLVAENLRLQGLSEENRRLRELLGFAQTHPTYRVLGGEVIDRAEAGVEAADVIGSDPNPYLRYLIIDRGEADGVAVGMPVVTEGGSLVGRVAQVGLRWAKVQLLTDPGSRVSGLIQRSRVTGPVEGRPDGSLWMVWIPQEETIQIGDLVLTSGLGGNLPRGLIIGQVIAVEKQEIELAQSARLRPAVDFNRVEMVLVITDFTPVSLEEPPPEEEAGP